jgi:hypothetical protein
VSKLLACNVFRHSAASRCDDAMRVFDTECAAPAKSVDAFVQIAKQKRMNVRIGVTRT